MGSPLIQRSLNRRIAYINQPLSSLDGLKGFVTVDQFFDHVCALSRLLPDNAHVINLCENRYLFLVAVCAGILRDQVTLLPPNANVETQNKLSQRYANTYVLHDGAIEVSSEVESLSLAECSLLDRSETLDTIPMIPMDQLVVISFTSGSTGDSKPNLKTWRALTVSTEINRQHMIPQDKPYTILATVPGQHMWGFETSVLMALYTEACMVDAKPFYPKDIQLLLEKIPEPRVLVSAPIHLKALVSSGVSFPNVDITLCATSPLSKELAQQTEALFSGRLHEVYGCSEVGSMALRKTAIEEEWTIFKGIDFEKNNDGGEFINVKTQHLLNDHRLNDRLELIGDRQFKFLGRATDMVDIAGKRGSLAELNQIMLNYEGVADGAIIFPEQQKAIPRIVAVLVLKKGYDKAQFKTYFSQQVDAAFVPRKIFLVEKMPRESTGKLPAKKIIALYEELSSKRH